MARSSHREKSNSELGLTACHMELTLTTPHGSRSAKPASIWMSNMVSPRQIRRVRPAGIMWSVPGQRGQGGQVPVRMSFVPCSHLREGDGSASRAVIQPHDDSDFSSRSRCPSVTVLPEVSFDTGPVQYLRPPARSARSRTCFWTSVPRGVRKDSHEPYDHLPRPA